MILNAECGIVIALRHVGINCFIPAKSAVDVA